MSNTWKTVLWILVPAITVTGVLIWLTRKDKEITPDKEGPGKNASSSGSTAPIAKPITQSNPAFPLKNGSRNEYVKKLQQALKITADGIFGSQTESTLKTFAGLTEITDEKQLNALISKATTGATNTSRANELITKFNKGGYAMQGVTTSQWLKVQEDGFGALQPLNLQITIYKGTIYNNADYKLKGVTKMGNLLFEVTNGNLAGTWMGDPSTITVVAI